MMHSSQQFTNPIQSTTDYWLHFSPSSTVFQKFNSVNFINQFIDRRSMAVAALYGMLLVKVQHTSCVYCRGNVVSRTDRIQGFGLEFWSHPAMAATNRRRFKQLRIALNTPKSLPIVFVWMQCITPSDVFLLLSGGR